MALCDYKLCDLCGEKAFYDACVTDPRYCATWDHDVDEDPIGLAVLCPSWAKTHTVGVIPAWQPIETLRNVDRVLLSDGENVGEGEWRNKQQNSRGQLGAEGWFFVDDIEDARPFHPTHWMPLPKPPEGES